MHYKDCGHSGGLPHPASEACNPSKEERCPHGRIKWTNSVCPECKFDKELDVIDINHARVLVNEAFRKAAAFDAIVEIVDKRHDSAVYVLGSIHALIDEANIERSK